MAKTKKSFLHKRNLNKFKAAKATRMLLGPTKTIKGKKYKTMAGHRSFGLISGLTAIGGLIASAAGAASAVKNLVGSGGGKKKSGRVVSSKR